MRKTAMAVVVWSVSAMAQEPARDKMAYREFRYTGYGASDATRDGQVVERFGDAFLALSAPEPSGTLPTPQEVEDMKAYLARPHSGHAQELKAELYRKKVAKYEAAGRQAAAAATPGPALPSRKDIEAVVTLVDTLPGGVLVKDGAIATEGDAQLIGRFSINTQLAEKEDELLKRVKVLAATAGGNIVVLNYRREPGDGQGTAHGVTGIVVKATFDAKQLKAGKLPAGF